jgi:hypothetical protein
MKDISSDRRLFERNHKNSESFERDYFNFVKTKMQELTCSVNGEYISFLVEITKTVTLKRGNSEILSMHFSNPKRDNVERYYNDLEKMIKKLQDLT